MTASKPDLFAAGETPFTTSDSTPAHSPAESRSSSGEHAELQRQGAKAAARGEALGTNPMLDSINQPLATGESEQMWSVRRDAWESGHTSQRDSFNSAVPAALEGAARERLEDEALFGVTRVLTFLSGRGLTSASGFLFQRDEDLFLVTSRHVLFDLATGHAPDRIEIELHADAKDLTQLTTLSILLYRDGKAVWRQARDTGGEVDVAALAIHRSVLPVGCVVRPFGPQHIPADFDLFEVGDRLAVPGFPLGFFDTVHHLPVVRQASIASFYGVRFQGQGYFLTDARMHRGCSGSPVLARRERNSADRPRWWLLVCTRAAWT